MSLKDLKTGEIVDRIRQNRISIDDLSKSQILDLKFYAEESQKENLKFIYELISSNPGTDLEFWKIRHQNYILTENLIKWLQQSEQRNVTANTISLLPLKAIALYHVYSGKQITRQNGNDIAEEYGYKSGEKLYQHFSWYSSRMNRIGDPDSKSKIENKISLIETVLKILPPDKKAQASDELRMLKISKNTEYQ
jgi:hypothetical protein